MPTRPKPLTIDGSAGEGGGQVLRSALSLALLTGRPFRLANVRAHRQPPGLRPQHLKAVEAAVALCGGSADGAFVGSRDLTFRPAPYTPRDLHVAIGTAGSTALVLHTLALPIAMRATGPVQLTITGGTFNESAPSYPFLVETWRPLMASLGLPIVLDSPVAGFYPKGGGRLDARIGPATPLARHLPARGPLTRISGACGVARLPRAIADRMRRHALSRLAAHGLDTLADLAVVEWPSAGPGAATSLTAEHPGFPATFVGLGRRGRPAEAVVDEAVDALLAHEAGGGLLDPHSADQVLLPLALAEGPSSYTVSSVTEHLRTNVATLGAFLDRPIRVEVPPRAPARVFLD